MCIFLCKLNQSDILVHPNTVISKKCFTYSETIIYIYIYMIKISGKVDKSNIYNRFSSNISFLIQGRTSSEQNITTKPIVSVWFIHISTYLYHLVRFTKIYHFIYIYIYIYIYEWRCSSCNSNHHWKWTQQPKFKSWIRLFAFHIVLMTMWKVCI